MRTSLTALLAILLLPSTALAQPLIQRFRELEASCRTGNTTACEEASAFSAEHDVDLRQEELKAKCDRGDQAACRRYTSNRFTIERGGLNQSTPRPLPSPTPGEDQANQDKEKQGTGSPSPTGSPGPSPQQESIAADLKEASCFLFVTKTMNGGSVPDSVDKGEQFVKDACRHGCSGACAALKDPRFKAQLREKLRKGGGAQPGAHPVPLVMPSPGRSKGGMLPR